MFFVRPYACKGAGQRGAVLKIPRKYKKKRSCFHKTFSVV